MYHPNTSPAFCSHLPNPHPHPHPHPHSTLRPKCPLIRATADEVTSTSAQTRPNITKYKSQRSIISMDPLDLTPDEVNNLMLKAGNPSRDIDKWKRALKGSYAVVFARLISDKTLVAFARATSDRALNATIWDVVSDPSLPNEALMKRNIVRYLLKELRRSVPGCSIALFSSDQDKSFFEDIEFVADPDGIRAMALFDPPNDHNL